MQLKIKLCLSIIAVGFAILMPQSASAQNDPYNAEAAQIAIGIAQNAYASAQAYYSQLNALAQNPRATEAVKIATFSAYNALIIAKANLDTLRTFWQGNISKRAISQVLNGVLRQTALVATEFMEAEGIMATIDAAAAAASLEALAVGGAYTVLTAEIALLGYATFDWFDAMQALDQAEQQFVLENQGLILKGIMTQQQVDDEAVQLQIAYNQAGVLGWQGYFSTMGRMYLPTTTNSSYTPNNISSYSMPGM